MNAVDVDKAEVRIPTVRAEMKNVSMTVPVWNCPHCRSETVMIEPVAIRTLHQQGWIDHTCQRCGKAAKIILSLIITSARSVVSRSAPRRR